MFMKTSTKKILDALHVLAWICFIGVLFEAGSFLFNMIYSVGFQPLAADYFNLEGVLALGKSVFCFLLTLTTVVAVLKALAMYRIIKIFTEKKLNLKAPFNQEFGRFIFALSYFSLAIGFVAFLTAEYVESIQKQNVFVPSLQRLRVAGSDVWVFMGATLYVIALIFKRGVEMQSENELTI